MNMTINSKFTIFDVSGTDNIYIPLQDFIQIQKVQIWYCTTTIKQGAMVSDNTSMQCSMCEQAVQTMKLTTNLNKICAKEERQNLVSRIPYILNPGMLDEIFKSRKPRDSSFPAVTITESAPALREQPSHLPH